MMPLDAPPAAFAHARLPSEDLPSLLRALTRGGTAAAPSPQGQAQASEPLRGVTVAHREVTNPSGVSQRVIVTAPSGPTRARTTVFVVGWLSCDSVVIPPSGPGTDGTLAILKAVIERSGMTVVRVEKPGIGGSGGRCSETDFETELAGYRAAFRAAATYPEVDPARIIVLGLSNGGGVAPLVVGGTPPIAYVSVGGWGRSWIEHMVDLERRRLSFQEPEADSLAASMRRWVRFHDLYLNDRLSPAAIVAREPRLSGLWYDQPLHQYGRPIAYFQQLNALDLVAAWRSVTVPVLALRGEFDWIMNEADVRAIVDARRGTAAERRLLTIPRGGHSLELYPSQRAAFRGEGVEVHEETFAPILEFLSRFSR